MSNFICASINLTNLKFIEIVSVEKFLGNFSFISLFLIMILYWIQSIFFSLSKFNFIIFITTLFATIALLLLLLLRWLNYGHFPLSNLYESLIFLSWSFTLVQLFFINPISNFSNSNLNNETYLNQSQSKNLTSSLSSEANFSNVTANINFNSAKNLKQQFLDININAIIGIVLSPIAFFTNSFATFSLPKSMQKAQALVPALQSNWLMMHVTVMMLSYTALLCGSLLAIAFLIIKRIYRDNNNTKFLNLTKLFSNNNNDLLVPLTKPTLLETKIKKNNKNEGKFFLIEEEDGLLYNQQSLVINVIKTLDNFSYRTLGIGFLLLTIGILSGAVWANEAWGAYWSWDPKETWAFITWLVFAIYLHTRINQGWQGEKSAIIAGFGFFVVWVCYLGVNILGTGLHSYGWFTI